MFHAALLSDAGLLTMVRDPIDGGSINGSRLLNFITALGNYCRRRQVEGESGSSLTRYPEETEWFQLLQAEADGALCDAGHALIHGYAGGELPYVPNESLEVGQFQDRDRMLNSVTQLIRVLSLRKREETWWYSRELTERELSGLAAELEDLPLGTKLVVFFM